MGNVCKCGKGYASLYDNMCCFCRECTVSRADAKRLGVKHRGDGLQLTQLYSPSGRNLATGKTNILAESKAKGNNMINLDFDEVEQHVSAYIVAQCPEFANRINSLRTKERVSLSTCKYCGEDIMWSSNNQYKFPLNPKDGSSHLCQTKTKQENNPWADGECPYCGELDCDCGV